MDIEEWELLPDEGFLGIHDDGGKKINPKGTTVFHMNYFICPSNVVDPVPQHNHPKNQLPPLSLHLLEPRVPKKPPDQESAVPPVEITKFMPPPTSSDPVSQVFFKKMKEAEFVDIKVDSPRSASASSRGFVPQLEGAAVFQFEEKGPGQNDAPRHISEIEIRGDDIKDPKRGDQGGLNIWKLSLTGIGAICSLGVTVCCIIVFRSSTKMSNKHPRQNQKFQSQAHTNDKRIKQGVNHASRLSEALSAVRGVPIAKARITCGGHYDHAPI